MKHASAGMGGTPRGRSSKIVRRGTTFPLSLINSTFPPILGSLAYPHRLYTPAAAHTQRRPPPPPLYQYPPPPHAHTEYPEVQGFLLKRQTHMYTWKYRPADSFGLYGTPPPTAVWEQELQLLASQYGAYLLTAPEADWWYRW